MDAEGELMMQRGVIEDVLRGGREEEESGPSDGTEEEKGLPLGRGASKGKHGAAAAAAAAAAETAAPKPRMTEEELKARKAPDYLSKTVFVRGLPLDVMQVCERK